MASISEQRCRIHKHPSSAFRARQDNICAQSNKGDAATSITFTEGKKSEGRGMEKIVDEFAASSTTEVTNGAHLHFATSRSIRRRGRGRDHASVNDLQRSHENANANASSTVRGHDVRSSHSQPP